jgi:hypothetical protein
MSNKLNTNLTEQITEPTVSSSSDPVNKSSLPVDHCKLRPLSEVYSTMCAPTPNVTTKCIIPEITTPSYEEGTCALYRYDSPQNILNTIKDRGYYVFRNMISKEQLEIANTYFYDHKVNYNKLLDLFIKPHMLKKVGSELDKNLISIKYRASNNNNSSDAGSFHRDLHIKNNETRVNNHTVLTYLDGGIMQLIPKSNRNQAIDLLDIGDYYNNLVELRLNPGDVLIFEMATIHRGVFYKKQPSRRLIQLFDTVFEEELSHFLKTTLHISCGDTCSQTASSFLISMNKNKKYSEFLNSLGYFNAALGYSKLPSKYFSAVPNIKYLSTESNQPRLEVINNTFQIDNHYIMNFETKDITTNDRKMFLFLSFILNQILVILLICVVIAIIILMFRLASDV